MAHLHDGILQSIKKEGAPTLCNSMDGTGEHYAMWNKPVGERQIPWDPTYKWNLINKTNKQANITRDIKIKNKLIVTRGVGRREQWQKEGEGPSRNMYKGPMDKAKRGSDWWWEVGVGGAGKVVVGKWRQLYLNNNKKRVKKRTKIILKKKIMTANGLLEKF